MDSQFPLRGKRAFVGGASQGIGAAGAIALARLGASVTVAARNADALSDVVASLDSAAEQAHGVAIIDNSHPSAMADVIGKAIAENGAYHILVNNTGGPPAGPLFDASTDQLTNAMTQHVLAFQSATQRVVPGMKEDGYGRIINVISTSVVMPIMGLGVSNTIRGAVANWGRTMAGELGPFGITVNNVLPGFTATDRLAAILDKKAERLKTTRTALEDSAMDGIPLRRFAEPSELGEVIAFLASPAASYISGVNLPVDGGRTAVQ